MSRPSRRRYRKAADRRVWVFSELNHDLAPEQIAKILTSAGLEQARLEAEAQAVDRNLRCGAPHDAHNGDGEQEEESLHA